MSIREILVIIGAVIILGIIIDNLWRKKRNQVVKHNVTRQNNRRPNKPTTNSDQIKNAEPIVKVNVIKSESIQIDRKPKIDQPIQPAAMNPHPDLLPTPPKVVQQVPEQNIIEHEPEVDDYIILTVMANNNKSFQGFELLQALLKAGLKHGDMNIFHRHRDLDNKSPIYFSVASVTKPGYFDIQNMNKCCTKGLSMFMSVPDVCDATNVFEIMLSTATQLAEKLNGTVCDRQRQQITDKYLDGCRARARISGNIQQQMHDIKQND